MSILNKKINIGFIGTSDFGLPAFKKLFSGRNYNIKFVITQPDKKAGRKQELKKSPIKLEAEKNNISVFQPEKIKNFSISEKNLDLIIVIAYGQIIPENILNLPKFGCLNIHGSLLPRYRGASCIQAPILNGDNETGITIIKMDKGLDTGPIIAQEKIKISSKETTGSLFEKLSVLGADLLIKTIPLYINNEIKLIPQKDSVASCVSKITKEISKINWNQSAEKVEQFIRAMHPRPGSFSFFNDGKKYKIIQADLCAINKNLELGALFAQSNKLYIQCAGSSIHIEQIQLEGKKIISGKDFIKGYSKYISPQIN